MIDKPLVTIAVPTRNRSKDLAKALEALLAQTYTNIEVLISDNASTDETPAICSAYAAGDARIRCFRQDRNIGLVANHNFLLRHAAGKYFMWACDDDYWERTFVEVLMGLLSDSEDGAVAMCDYDHVVNGTRHPRPPLTYDNTRSRLESVIDYIRSTDYSSILGLYVTDILKEAGGYHADGRPFYHCSDYLTVLKVLLRGSPVFAGEVLLHKGDSGSFVNRYAVLKKGEIDRQIVLKIVRFLLSPTYYVYDLAYSVPAVSKSEFNGPQRRRLILRVVGSCFRRNWLFLKEVIVGICCLVQGLPRMLRGKSRGAE